MKNRKILSLICVIVILLLIGVPIPRRSKQEGVTHLCSIIPFVEIYVYDYVTEAEHPVGMQSEAVRKQGHQLRLAGMTVYEKTAWTPLEEWQK